MGGYQAMTSYDPNGTMRQATSGPAGGGGGVAGPAPVLDPMTLIQYKMNLDAQQRAADEARKNRALDLQEWQMRNAAARDDQASGPTQRPMMESRRAAPPPEDRGQPVFTKTVGTGPGQIPGQMRLSRWEPGAAFAGYEKDLGTGPANSTFSPVAMQAQAQGRGIAAGEWEDFQESSGAAPRGGAMVGGGMAPAAPAGLASPLVPRPHAADPGAAAGASPVLTPATASAPGRALSREEQRAQMQRNMTYGRR